MVREAKRLYYANELFEVRQNAYKQDPRVLKEVGDLILSIFTKQIGLL